jgi:hypothetical protein
MKQKLIRTELLDGIATVVIDHPPANAMNTWRTPQWGC